MKKYLFILILLFFVFNIYSVCIFDIKGKGVKKITEKKYLYILSKNNYLNVYKNEKTIFKYAGYSRTNYYIADRYLYIWETRYNKTILKIFDIEKEFVELKEIKYDKRLEYIYKSNGKIYLFFIHGGIIESNKPLAISKSIDRISKHPFWDRNFYNVNKKLIFYFNKKFYFFENGNFIRFLEIPTNYYEINNGYILYKNNDSKIELYSILKRKKIFSADINKKWENANVQITENNRKINIFFVLNNEVLFVNNGNQEHKKYDSKVLFVDSDGRVITEKDELLKTIKDKIDEILKIVKVGNRYYLVSVNYSFFSNKYYVIQKYSL
ncbi:MAG: hypothetical protein FXF47_05135 [Candidatus Mcinerneyibacterium aminivorans]|uniref:Uncharacterized protein n=1 Tax=Candidatus Mcinerneyibacterium aminivorans TaxID=2703815 RepID=A0A5D0MJ08_9BACT|nr:MAG: hypothetical protein FXF47_05135 [Candidatus Mcinerneyibacterium aminivorans]